MVHPSSLVPTLDPCSETHWFATLEPARDAAMSGTGTSRIENVVPTTHRRGHGRHEEVRLATESTLADRRECE